MQTIQLVEIIINKNSGSKKYEYDNLNRVARILFYTQEWRFYATQTFTYNGDDLITTVFNEVNALKGVVTEHTKDGNTTVSEEIVYKFDNNPSPFLNCKTPKWYFFDDIVGVNNVVEKSWYGGKNEYWYEYDKNGFPTQNTMQNSDGNQFITTYQYIFRTPETMRETPDVEPDIDFRDRFFSLRNFRTLLKEGKHHEIDLVYVAEYDLAGRVRQGYLAELRGDYETAKNCYDSVKFTERNAVLEEKISLKNHSFY